MACWECRATGEVQTRQVEVLGAAIFFSNQQNSWASRVGVIRHTPQEGDRRRYVAPEAAPLRMVIPPRVVRDYVRVPGACPEVVKRWGTRAAI